MTRPGRMRAGRVAPRGGGRAGGRSPAISPAVIVSVLTIAFFVVLGTGFVEMHLAAPCNASAIFGAAGDHGRSFCYALKGSTLGAVLAGEAVLLCILLLLLAASKARLHDRILGDAALRAAGMVGVVLLLAVNTPVVTSSMILAGCTVRQPHTEEGVGPASWCSMPLSAHPVLFEKKSKIDPRFDFDLHDARMLQRLILA